MKIARVQWRPVGLRLRQPIATAHGILDRRPGIWLRCEDGDGAGGEGIAQPLAGFGLESLAEAEAAVEGCAKWLVREDEVPLDRLLDGLEANAPAAPTARSALDAALHDLAARREGVSVARLRNPASRTRVGVSGLLGGDDDAALEASVEHVLSQGMRAAKLKVGVRPVAEDVARLARVRRLVGPGFGLRADANGAWTLVQARQAVAALGPLGLEWIEQPVASVADLATLRSDGAVRIAADESATGPVEASRVLAAGAADVLVLKITACGGLRAAARIEKQAREAGVGCIASSLLDSSLGIAAALHAAASWPVEPRGCGLATASALADDLAGLAAIEDGAIALPAGRGLGLRAEAQALERLATGALRELRRG